MEEYDGLKKFFLHYRGAQRKKTKDLNPKFNIRSTTQEDDDVVTMCTPHNAHVHQTKLE
jgi:hypothetical protein